MCLCVVFVCVYGICAWQIYVCICVHGLCVYVCACVCSLSVCVYVNGCVPDSRGSELHYEVGQLALRLLQELEHVLHPLQVCALVLRDLVRPHERHLSSTWWRELSVNTKQSI